MTFWQAAWLLIHEMFGRVDARCELAPHVPPEDDPHDYNDDENYGAGNQPLDDEIPMTCVRCGRRFVWRKESQ